MTFYAKFAIFAVALFGTIWFIHRFPHHPTSRLAWLWYDPYPIHGETVSSFFARRALYSLKLFAQVAIAFLALWLLASWQPPVAETTLFMVFVFALPLLGGTFLLAAVLFAALSLKHRWFGPNPQFELGDDVPEVQENH